MNPSSDLPSTPSISNASHCSRCAGAARIRLHSSNPVQKNTPVSRRSPMLPAQAIADTGVFLVLCLLCKMLAPATALGLTPSLFISKTASLCSKPLHIPLDMRIAALKSAFSPYCPAALKLASFRFARCDLLTRHCLASWSSRNSSAKWLWIYRMAGSRRLLAAAANSPGAASPLKILWIPAEI